MNLGFVEKTKKSLKHKRCDEIEGIDCWRI